MFIPQYIYKAYLLKVNHKQHNELSLMKEENIDPINALLIIN